MKILNLYAGVGGNRRLWSDEHKITAIEIKPEIANIYKDIYPDDNVIIADAHAYLLEHYKEFDFIWSSPPCPSHSKLRFMHEKKIYPNMELYQEIILLKHFATGKYVIENVIPYYEPLIKPTKILHRHLFWSNFSISNKQFKSLQTCKAIGERALLQAEFGINLDEYKGIDKRTIIRNCVVPELGLHILSEATKQLSLF